MFGMLRGIFHRTFLLLLLGSGLALAGEAEWREHMEAGEAAQKRGDKFTATTSFDAALREAAKELRVSLAQSYMVGDRWSDIVAGAAAGCYTIKIERGYSNVKPSQPDAVLRSLAAAVRHIISTEKSHARH